MAVRKCPYCLAVVPAGEVLAYSNDLACPGCQRPLDISAMSRNIAIAAGLVAGWAVRHFTVRAESGGMLDWLMPVVYAFLALSVVAPLILIISADLRLREAASASAETAAEAGHGGGGGHH